MKSLLAFLFGYGQLGWKTRLSRQDHLYHQGRNALSLVLCGAFGGLLFGLMASPLGTGLIAVLPAHVGMVLMGLWFIVAALPFAYVAFAAFKLTVLRLHDFNLSAWWLLGLFLLSLIDGVLSHVLPGFSTFVSLRNLAYLALLILPANPAANRYGLAAVNSTAGKARWIRTVPLVMFALGWLMMVAVAFAIQYERNLLVHRINVMQANPTAAVLHDMTRQMSR